MVAPTNLNALIPLSGRDTNIGEAIIQGRAAKQNRTINDLAINREQETQRREAELEEATKQQLANFNSMVEGARRLRPLFPDSVDKVPAFIQAIDERVREVQARGGDPSDTLELRQRVLAGDIDGARAEIDEVIRIGDELRAQQFGVSAPPGRETTVLKPGDVLADNATGDEVARGRDPERKPVVVGANARAIDPETQRVILDIAEKPPEQRTPDDIARARAGVRRVVDNIRDDTGANDIAPNAQLFNDAINRRTGPGDTAAIIAFAKILDPGSVVRSQEGETIQRSDGIFGRLQAQLQSLSAEGAVLSDSARSELAALAQQRVQGASQAFQQRLQRERENFSDLNFDPAFIDRTFSEDPFSGINVQFSAQGSSGSDKMIRFDDGTTVEFE